MDPRCHCDQPLAPGSSNILEAQHPKSHEVEEEQEDPDFFDKDIQDMKDNAVKIVGTAVGAVGVGLNAVKQTWTTHRVGQRAAAFGWVLTSTVGQSLNTIADAAEFWARDFSDMDCRNEDEAREGTLHGNTSANPSTKSNPSLLQRLREEEMVAQVQPVDKEDEAPAAGPAVLVSDLPHEIPIKPTSSEPQLLDAPPPPAEPPATSAPTDAVFTCTSSAVEAPVNEEWSSAPHAQSASSALVSAPPAALDMAEMVGSSSAKLSLPTSSHSASSCTATTTSSSTAVTAVRLQTRLAAAASAGLSPVTALTSTATVATTVTTTATGAGHPPAKAVVSSSRSFSGTGDSFAAGAAPPAAMPIAAAAGLPPRPPASTIARFRQGHLVDCRNRSPSPLPDSASDGSLDTWQDLSKISEELEKMDDEWQEIEPENSLPLTADWR